MPKSIAEPRNLDRYTTAVLRPLVVLVLLVGFLGGFSSLTLGPCVGYDFDYEGDDVMPLEAVGRKDDEVAD